MKHNSGVHWLFRGLALASCPVLAACGTTPDHSAQHHAPAAAEQANSDAGQMNMGDPSATPADKIPGAHLRTNQFNLLRTRPPGTDNAAGSAWLATHPSGTTVTLQMTGLQPGENYIAHLHAKPCAEDNGGGHFKFDPAGPATPPNEVHLAFTADQTGNGFMTANNDRQADGAESVVVHPAVLTDNRVACADF
ncbi:hypothetical protein MOQ72_18605 [Saccharopolyspora sp. K220]|uniref:hypothetical protein n=1 Tax=Saccharopolyspora soli TaxID=2926618 RepID=UPI001F56CD79|nr:hypothetical protein [Saccharopolyspora soli]MCI2419457.1 hypothetical protein [Saccharopolyspora soli]